MKRFILCAAFILLASPADAREIEIDVHGMTCEFCVEALEKKLQAMAAVRKIEVSLEQNRILLQTGATEPAVEEIRQAVLDAGFMPTALRVDGKETQTGGP